MSGGAIEPTVLLFDFGGTLDADGIAWKPRFFSLWREEVDDVPEERFDAAFYAADDALVGSVALDLTLTETVARLARGVAHRLEQGEGEPSARVARRFSEDALDTLSRRGKLLSRLGSRFRLGIVSNYYGNLAAACAEAGIERNFSVLIDSTDVGCSKPEAGIFRAALDKVRARPEDAVFVGDSIARDMEGARALGMRHVLLRPGRSGDDPFLCCPDDRVIRRLEDIEEALP